MIKRTSTNWKANSRHSLRAITQDLSKRKKMKRKDYESLKRNRNDVKARARVPRRTKKVKARPRTKVSQRIQSKKPLKGMSDL